MSIKTSLPRGFRAFPTKEHDGDSFWVMTDGGFDSRAEPELRLLDVHAPELRAVRLPQMMQPGAAEARAFVNGWLQGARSVQPPRRWCLWVETVMTSTYEPDQKQTFTRYLAVVWMYDDASPWRPGETLYAISLNQQVTTFLSGHPEWGGGD